MTVCMCSPNVICSLSSIDLGRNQLFMLAIWIVKVGDLLEV